MRLSPTWAMKPRSPDHQQGRDGGPHAALVRLLLAPLEDGGAGRLDRLLEQRQDLLRCRTGASPLAKPSSSSLLGLDRVAKLVDGDVRGDLARGVPAHAVGDDEERELLVDEEVVLVVLALSPDVGRGPEAQLHVSLGGSSGGRPLASLTLIRRAGQASRPSGGAGGPAVIDAGRCRGANESLDSARAHCYKCWSRDGGICSGIV